MRRNVLQKKMKIPKFIDPTRISQSLHQVSLYLTAWETLCSAIIDRVKGFYTFNWNSNEQGKLVGEPDIDYKNKVLALAPNKEFHSCCLWLKNSGAINDFDLKIIDEARKHRNQIAHEIVAYITEEHSVVNRDVISNIYNVVKKIDIWWLTEVDMATDPKFSEEDYQVAKEGKAVGGYSFLLEIILPIFDGDFDTIVALHKEMKNHAEPKDGVYKS